MPRSLRSLGMTFRYRLFRGPIFWRCLAGRSGVCHARPAGDEVILLANSIQAAGRLGPADSKSGLGAFGRLSACADRSNRAENMSPKGDMRRNALRPEFIRRTRAVNQQYHEVAGL